MFNQPVQVKREKPTKCRIRIKKSQDGKVVDREISGCSPAEIKALTENQEE